MAPSHKKRDEPIEDFIIPSVHRDMDESIWKKHEQSIVWYGIPEENHYMDSEGASNQRCRIPVFSATKVLLGYVPLPSRYKPAWIYLCKHVTFRLCEWKLWVAESKMSRSRVPADISLELRRDSGTKLLQYFTIRRIIVNELLHAKKDKKGKDQLNVFDEYIIRESWDWLWTPRDNIPLDEEYVLALDPVDKSNKNLFRKCIHVFVYVDQKCLIVLNNLPEKVDKCNEWIWGSIPGYEEGWYDDMPALIRLVRNEKRRDAIAERPWRRNGETPHLWHEMQRPTLLFLSEDEDLNFMSPRCTQFSSD